MSGNFICLSKLLPAAFIFTIFVISAAGQKYVSPDSAETTAIDAAGLKSLIKSPEKKQPILINFWATWCGPCKVEFPELVKIDADYRAQGLNFIIVSIDNLGAMDSIVADFLKSYESTMPSYLLDLSSRRQITKAIRQIAPTAKDGFPLTLLYNKNGKLVYQKNGVIDAKMLRTKIEKILKK